MCSYALLCVLLLCYHVLLCVTNVLLCVTNVLLCVLLCVTNVSLLCYHVLLCVTNVFLYVTMGYLMSNPRPLSILCAMMFYGATVDTLSAVLLVGWVLQAFVTAISALSLSLSLSISLPTLHPPP